MNGIVEGTAHNEGADTDRKDWPQFVLDKSAYGKPVLDFKMAAQFMSEACGLSLDQCWAWVMKLHFAEIRDGLWSGSAMTDRNQSLRMDVDAPG